MVTSTFEVPVRLISCLMIFFLLVLLDFVLVELGEQVLSAFVCRCGMEVDFCHPICAVSCICIRAVKVQTRVRHA